MPRGTSSTRARPIADRLLITGGSAGGYTTICALTFTDAFAAGTTYFGIADLEQFAGGRDAQVRAPVRAHARRAVSGARRPLQGAQSDPLHRPDLDADARAPGRRRPRRPAVAGRAHRRRAPRARCPARVPPLRRARATASARPRTSSARSRPSSRSTRRSSASSRPVRSLGSRSPTSASSPRRLVKTASSIARAMQSFVIEGGRPLSGTVRASGNKNGALPILAACVLASERGAALERPADPRRRDDGRAPRRSRRRRRVDRGERRPGRRERA